MSGGPRPPRRGPGPFLGPIAAGRLTPGASERGEARALHSAGMRGSKGSRGEEHHFREPRPLGELAKQGLPLFKRRAREGPAGEKT